MISINSIDVHIGHESSVGVYLAKRSRIYRIESAAMVSVMFVLLTIGGAPVGLVLVFAATRSEVALRSVFVEFWSLPLRLRKWRCCIPCPSRMSQYGKQNVEFLDVYVEIGKSKNELFEMSHILIYLATF